MSQIVTKAKVQAIANIINKQYEIGNESYKVQILDRRDYDGRTGHIIVTENAGLDAIEVSMLGNVDNYCRKHGIFVEPINSALLGVYHV
jgi:hypothetical protein